MTYLVVHGWDYEGEDVWFITDNLKEAKAKADYYADKMGLESDDYKYVSVVQYREAKHIEGSRFDGGSKFIYNPRQIKIEDATSHPISLEVLHNMRKQAEAD